LHNEPQQYSRKRGTLPGFAAASGKVLLIINLSKPEKARVH